VKILSYAKLTRLFTIYLHGSNNSLDISLKQNAKDRRRAATILLFHILQRLHIFRGLFLGHVFIGPNIALVLQIVATATLIIIIGRKV
jgi:hypothetical protein